MMTTYGGGQVGRGLEHLARRGHGLLGRPWKYRALNVGDLLYFELGVPRMEGAPQRGQLGVVPGQEGLRGSWRHSSAPGGHRPMSPAHPLSIPGARALRGQSAARGTRPCASACGPATPCRPVKQGAHATRISNAETCYGGVDVCLPHRKTGACRTNGSGHWLGTAITISIYRARTYRAVQSLLRQVRVNV
jgi:hypothetical protein